MERKLSILSNNDGLIDLYIEEFIEFDSSIIDDNSFQCLETSYKSVITKDEIDELVYEELEEKIDDIVSDVLCDYRAIGRVYKERPSIAVCRRYSAKG